MLAYLGRSSCVRFSAKLEFIGNAIFFCRNVSLAGNLSQQFEQRVIRLANVSLIWAIQMRAVLRYIIPK